MPARMCKGLHKDQSLIMSIGFTCTAVPAGVLGFTVLGLGSQGCRV